MESSFSSSSLKEFLFLYISLVCWSGFSLLLCLEKLFILEFIFGVSSLIFLTKLSKKYLANVLSFISLHNALIFFSNIVSE